MKNKKPIALYVVSIIAILMCVGHLYCSKEMTIHDILDVPDGEIVSIVPVVQHVSDDTGFVMGTLSSDCESELFEHLLTLLDDCVFSPTPGNLLPWRDPFVADAEAEYTFDCAFTVLSGGQEQLIHMKWYGEHEAGVQTDGADGWFIYHPSDPEMLEALYDYMAANGSPI